MDPAGCISEAQEVLRRTLADCPRWREFCDAPGQEAARARIHHEDLPTPATGGVYTKTELNNYRPYAIVSTAETGGLTRSLESVGTSAHFDTSGVLWLLVGAAVDDTLSTVEQDRQFKNFARMRGFMAELSPSHRLDSVAAPRRARNFYSLRPSLLPLPTDGF